MKKKRKTKKKRKEINKELWASNKKTKKKGRT